MQLFQNEFGEISYDSGSAILTLVWSGADMNAENFKNVTNIYADHSVEQNAARLLVDAVKFNFAGARSPELTKWRNNIIIPKYHSAGVNKFAFVHAEGFTAPPTNGQPIEGENFITMHFGNESEAKAWLAED